MKKQIILLSLLACAFFSCNVQQYTPASQPSVDKTVDAYGFYSQPEDIMQSLFSDKDATITEENIQRILNGKYKLPETLRVAIVNLENNQYRRYYWNDEDYLSSRQKYLETLTQNFKNQNRVKSVSLIPEIMLPGSPTFGSIREAAVRMQADVVIVYSVSGGMYSNYKMFKGSTYKAFATTQVLMIDVRTGLVPFTRVISKDTIAKKEDSDFNSDEARKRIQEEAVMKTLDEICSDLNNYINQQ